MPKQEKFVIRTCGCHAGEKHWMTFTAVGRPAAIRAAEQIGKFDQESKKQVVAFLEGTDKPHSRVSRMMIEGEGDQQCDMYERFKTSHSVSIMEVDGEF